MKILGICGSPRGRKSQTKVLLQKVLEAAKSRGAGVELVDSAGSSPTVRTSGLTSTSFGRNRDGCDRNGAYLRLVWDDPSTAHRGRFALPMSNLCRKVGRGACLGVVVRRSRVPPSRSLK